MESFHRSFFVHNISVAMQTTESRDSSLGVTVWKGLLEEGGDVVRVLGIHPEGNKNNFMV